jgi:flagella basal body P-ring formation protein FlgA
LRQDRWAINHIGTVFAFHSAYACIAGKTGRLCVRYLAVILVVTLGALGLAVPASAQQKFENLDRVDSLVASTVGANIGQPGGAMAPVDRRLRLAACPSLPNVTGPQFGAAIVKCAALGWQIRVPLLRDSSAQSASSARAAAAPKAEVLVRKGDPVQLIAGSATFSISRAMIADEDGSAGQMIRVREDRKSAPVIAEVIEPGIVHAAGFSGI